MRTAIFVYKPVSINISTCETGLELCGLNAVAAPLAVGDNTQTVAPGIYKIVSSHDVVVTGDGAALDVVVTIQNKDNDPTPPSRAITQLAPLDLAALHAFFAVPAAKQLANP
jgi:hypothetical protein